MVDKYLELIYQGLDKLSDGNVVVLVVLFCILTMTEFGVPFPLVLQGVRFYIGYEIGQGSTGVLLLIPIFIIGRQLGAAIMYWFSRLSSTAVISWYPKRFRRMQQETEKMKEKLHAKTTLAVGAVILSRFTPGLLVPTSLASGGIGLRYGYFALGVLISSIIFDATFITLGAIFGKEVKHEGLSIISWLILACFISLTCLLWAVHWLRKRWGHSSSEMNIQ